MDKKLFAKLSDSMDQMSEIVRGERAPSREFSVNASGLRKVRVVTGLSQEEFARVVDAQIGTLRKPA